MQRDEWYVAWVVTGQEQTLLHKLQQVDGIEQSLCPQQSLWLRRAGSWTSRKQLLFPGYIFLRCRMNAAIYYAIKALPGVLGWLGRDTLWPTTVRQEEMHAVLALAQGDTGVLQSVEIHKRQRRGYGTLTLQGKSYRIPFNIYDKQTEELPGDTSPEAEPAEQ